MYKAIRFAISEIIAVIKLSLLSVLIFCFFFFFFLPISSPPINILYHGSVIWSILFHNLIYILK